MPTVNIYLTFDGNCEAAFNFYAQALEKDITMMSRFKEMPEDPNFVLTEADKEKIMHVSLPISEETILMGSDTGGEWAAGFKTGNNFSVSLSADSKAEANKLFQALAEGGQVTMPMADTFWESYFGMLIDRFGISWMVSFDAKQ